MDVLTLSLYQVLEVGTCHPGSESGHEGSKDIPLDVGPVVLVDVLTVVEAVPPDEGPVSQGHIALLAFSLICAPSCNWGSFFDACQ